MKKWVMYGLGAIVAIGAYVLAPKGDILISALYSLLAGAGVAFAVYAVTSRASRKMLLPALALAWLLVAPWLTLEIDLLSLIFTIVSIVALLYLGYEKYKELETSAGSKDDDVRRGGYEVWK